MQVQKYKLGNAFFEKNFATGSYYCATTDDWMSENGLKLAGATPLIESEEMLEEDADEILNEITSDGSNNRIVLSGSLAYVIQDIHKQINENTRAINALQKGVK